MQLNQTIENHGWAGLFAIIDGEEVEVEDSAILSKGDGLILDDDLADYLQDGGDEQRRLFELGVRGGKLTLKFNPKTKRLYCSIVYSGPSELSDAELASLREFSNGQLTDGAGSNPIKVPVFGEEYFVHLGNE